MVVWVPQEERRHHRQLEKAVAEHLEPLIAGVLVQHGRGGGLEEQGDDLRRRALRGTRERGGAGGGGGGGGGEQAEEGGAVVREQRGAEADEHSRKLQKRPPAPQLVAGGRWSASVLKHEQTSVDRRQRSTTGVCNRLPAHQPSAVTGTGVQMLAAKWAIPV